MCVESRHNFHFRVVNRLKYLEYEKRHLSDPPIELENSLLISLCNGWNGENIIRCDKCRKSRHNNKLDENMGICAKITHVFYLYNKNTFHLQFSLRIYRPFNDMIYLCVLHAKSVRLPPHSFSFAAFEQPLASGD